MKVKIIKGDSERDWWYDPPSFIGAVFDVRRDPNNPRRLILLASLHNHEVLKRCEPEMKGQYLFGYCYVLQEDCVIVSVEDNASAVSLLKKDHIL